MPPHPIFFARRSVYEKYGDFNLNELKLDYGFWFEKKLKL
jgi:hypothetical protein